MKPDTRNRSEYQSDYQRSRRSKIANIAPLPKPKLAAARKRYEKDLAGFLRYFMPELFGRAFGRNMLHAIGCIEKAVFESRCLMNAMPRGLGKSTVAMGALIWAAVYGHRKYLVVLASDQANANRILGNIQSVFEGQCPKLCKSFPEVAYPVEKLEGRGQRCASQHIDNQPTEMIWRNDLIVFATVAGSATSGVVIQAKGITSNGIRGLNFKGTRPDQILLDDIGNNEAASSVEQTNKLEDIILSSVMGLAGHRKNISIAMIGTCIKDGDITSRFLDHERHPAFQGFKTKLVDRWPTKKKIWEKYADIRAEDLAAGKGMKRCKKFVKDHYNEMHAGSDLAAAELYDPQNEVSALHHAYNLKFALGNGTFESEYQNAPPTLDTTQFILAREQVTSHMVKIPAFELPKNATVLTGHCDINRSGGGLHWTIGAFDQSMTCHIPAYGHYPRKGDLYPRNAPPQIVSRGIFDGLKAVCNQLKDAPFVQDGKKINLDLLLIDAGWEGATVHRFIEWATKSGGYPFRIYADIGRGAKTYRFNPKQLIGSPSEQCHYQRGKEKRIRYTVQNADFWREVVQRSFLYAPGSVGGTTIFKATSERYHEPFADHIVAERLINKYETAAGTRWEYTKSPGESNDWGDSTKGAFVAAAILGLRSAGEPVAVKKKKKINVVINRPGRGKSMSVINNFIKTKRW